MLETKNAKVRRLVSLGQYMEALKICKDWDYSNPTHRSILKRGYECKLYPRFYEQLGYTPSSEYEKAVAVLSEVYGKDC